MVSLYDRVLLEVGNEGEFQKKFAITYIVIFSSLWAMAYYNIILALTVTPHTCKLPVKPENISEDLWKAKYIPRLESAGNAEKYSDCLIYTNLGNNDTKSYSRIAEVIGSLFFGWFGDVYGRKLTFIISLAFLIIGRLISLLSSSSFIFFTIGCIIAWFPSWSAPQSAAVISLEIWSPKRRATVAKLKLVATSFGMFLMPFFFWWLRNWKLFLFITTVLQLPFLMYSWKLIESPQWLWINGKSKWAVKTLKNIAKVNKTSISADIESEILTTTPLKTSGAKALGPLALFSGSRIAINTVLQLLLWFAISLNYGVTILSSGEKPNGNPFLDFAWQALAEIPGYFIAAWLANNIGRRYTGILSLSLSTTFWIIDGFSLMRSDGWLSNEVLSTLLVVTNRFSITISYYIINLLNMELYPTCLRQSGMSLGNLISSGASAFAPYVLHLGRRVDVRCPSVIVTITTLLCGVLPSVFLPETLNKKLPVTLEDAKNF